VVTVCGELYSFICTSPVCHSTDAAYWYFIHLPLDIIVSLPLIDLIHSFIPLAHAECDDSLLFSGISSIPLCYILFLATLLRQLSFLSPSLHLAIYFLVYLSALLFPNSYIILFWEFCFLLFSVHAQTNIIYLTLLSLLQWVFLGRIHPFTGHEGL